jgi:hypothetical protein
MQPNRCKRGAVTSSRALTSRGLHFLVIFPRRHLGDIGERFFFRLGLRKARLLPGHPLHSGFEDRTTRLVWGLRYSAWAIIHQVCSALMLVIVAWHLWLNRKPLFAWLKRASQWRRQAPTFFALFTFAVVTAMAAWIAGKLLDSKAVEHALVEIHDRVVIPMSVLMVMHTWRRRARLLR